jgi:hypothetical protein
MTKETQKRTFYLIGALIIIAIIQTLVGIKAEAGMQKSPGAGIALFYQLQIGGGDSTIWGYASLLGIAPIMVSWLLIYQKNRKVLGNVFLRITPARYIRRFYWYTFAVTAVTIAAIFVIEFLLIALLYGSTQLFNPSSYLRMVKVIYFSQNDLYNILIFALFSSIGMGVFAVLTTSIGLWVSRTPVFMLTGLILSIFLTLGPALLDQITQGRMTVFLYSTFFTTLVAPGQMTFGGKLPSANLWFAYLLSLVLYSFLALLSTSLWLRKTRRGG